MPYIPQEDRERLYSEILSLAAKVKTEGDLNYAIFKLLRYFSSDQGGNYAAFNRAMGVMDCCSREFYRRIIAPYEDKAIERNGDIQ